MLFNSLPNSTPEAPEILDVWDYLFVNTDFVEKDTNLKYIIPRLLSEYDASEVKIYFAWNKTAISLSSFLKSQWYSTEKSADMNIEIKPISRWNRGDIIVTLKQELHEAIWEEADQFFHGSNVHWLALRLFLSQQKKCKLLGMHLSQEFLQSLEADDIDIRNLWYQMYKFGAADKIIQGKAKTWQKRIWSIHKEKKDQWSKSITVFIANSDFWKILNHSVRQKDSRSARNDNNVLLEEFFLKNRREDGAIKYLHTIGVSHWKSRNLIKEALKVKNMLTSILTDSSLVYWPKEQRTVDEMIQRLDSPKSRKSKKNKALERKLTSEIQHIVAEIKKVQIWRIISQVRAKMKILQKSKFIWWDASNISNIAMKRRNWGAILHEVWDDARDIVMEITDFIDSTIWRESFQTLESVLNFDGTEHIVTTTDKLRGPKLLEFLFVDLLESRKWRRNSWEYVKGHRFLDLVAKTDFMFSGEDLRIGYQLFSWSVGSRIANTKKNSIYKYQEKLREAQKKWETSISSSSTELWDITLPISEVPWVFVLLEVQLSRAELWEIKNYYREYIPAEDENILSEQHDVLSDKLKAYSDAVERINTITINGDQKNFNKIFTGGLHSNTMRMTWAYIHAKDEIEITVTCSGALVWRITLLSFSRIKNLHYEHQKRQLRWKKESNSRWNVRSPNRREKRKRKRTK